MQSARTQAFQSWWMYTHDGSEAQRIVHFPHATIRMSCKVHAHEQDMCTWHTQVHVEVYPEHTMQGDGTALACLTCEKVGKKSLTTLSTAACTLPAMSAGSASNGASSCSASMRTCVAWPRCSGAASLQSFKQEVHRVAVAQPFYFWSDKGRWHNLPSPALESQADETWRLLQRLVHISLPHQTV